MVLPQQRRHLKTPGIFLNYAYKFFLRSGGGGSIKQLKSLQYHNVDFITDCKKLINGLYQLSTEKPSQVLITRRFPLCCETFTFYQDRVTIVSTMLIALSQKMLILQPSKLDFVSKTRPVTYYLRSKFDPRSALDPLRKQDIRGAWIQIRIVKSQIRLNRIWIRIS